MEELAIGVVRGTHGLAGTLRVESLSGDTAHFLRLKRVTVVKNEHRHQRSVTSVDAAEGKLLLQLEGITTKEEAARLVGSELVVPRRHAAPRSRNEYYTADLVGCAVTQGKTHVGRVVDTLSTGAHDLLEIETASGDTVLVPFVREFVRRVRIRRRSVELAPGWSAE